jgi:hypothetical protein
MGFTFKGRGTGHVDQGMISEVRAYWEALRIGEMLPRRASVDPRGIAGALEHSFLIERIGPGLARFCIAGMAYNDLIGMDIRGMPISTLFVGKAQLALQMALERVFHNPAILTMDITAEHGLGRPHLGARLVVLPLLGHKGASDLAIGCIEISGGIGRAPRRFSIDKTRHEVVALPPAETASAVVPRPAFAEDARRFNGPTTTAKTVPYLRLVKG